jgi:hypothetical protein
MEKSATLPVDGLSLGIEDLEAIEAPSWLSGFVTGLGVGVAVGGLIFLT